MHIYLAFPYEEPSRKDTRRMVFRIIFQKKERPIAVRKIIFQECSNQALVRKR